jgi:hypothetical protein
MRLALSDDLYAAALTEIPRGYTEGFAALDARYEAQSMRTAGNHPHRLRMLNHIEDLPYTSYESLLQHGRTRFSASDRVEVDADWDHDTTTAERAAIHAEVTAATQLLTVLVLLSLAERNKHPLAALMTLLWSLGLLIIGPNTTTEPPTSNCRSTRAERPPGRLVVAEPRLARAPGLGVSLALHRSEGRYGPCAFRGNAIAA